MSNEAKISSAQLKRLQTLWTQYARYALWDAASREQRIKWASTTVKREVSSFNDLTSSEASDLINLVQAELGIAETSPASRKRRFGSRPKDRDRAQAQGTEGRRGHKGAVTIATPKDHQLIAIQVSRLGWDQSRLNAFLNSPSSPLKGRSNPELRTLADVNQVYWALKAIADRQAKAEAQP